MSQETDSDFAFSRRALLLMGAGAAIALSLPALPARAEFAYGDIKTLRFLEEVARLEADFFFKAAMSAPVEAFSERQSNTLNAIARQDDELVRWFGSARDKYGLRAFNALSTRNQASSRQAPTYRFPLQDFEKRDGILARALEIKTLAVGAFHGAVGEARDPKMVEAFAALAGVQGRHLALLNEIGGQSPFVPVEAALSLADVSNQLASYGFNAEVIG